MYKDFGNLPQEDSVLFLERVGINSSELCTSYEKYPDLLLDEDFLHDSADDLRRTFFKIRGQAD